MRTVKTASRANRYWIVTCSGWGVAELTESVGARSPRQRITAPSANRKHTASRKQTGWHSIAVKKVLTASGCGIVWPGHGGRLIGSVAVDGSASGRKPATGWWLAWPLGSSVMSSRFRTAAHYPPPRPGRV